MKNLTLVFTCLFFIGNSLMAQTHLKAIVYSISGKVKYAAFEGAKFQKLQTGMDIAPQGSLDITPGSSVGIYYDEEYAVVDQSGTSPVNSFLSNIELFNESETAEVFGEGLNGALHPYFGTVKLKSFGFATTVDGGIPPPPKKGKDGHGNKEYKIVRLQPSGGKVADNNVVFRWKMSERSQKIKSFKFILRSSSNEVLFEKVINGFSFQLSPADYQMEAGKSYKWKVEAASDSSVGTPNITFTFVDASSQRAIMDRLYGDDMYQKADAATRLLLEACLLENNDFLSKANEKFETAGKNYKKNNLAQMMYKAFLWRYDMVE